MIQFSPIYVDLDGTVSMTDTMLESMLIFLKKNPFNFFKLLFWLCSGRLNFKRQLANSVTLPPESLLFNDAFVAYLKQQKNLGCPIILASASMHSVVQDVAKYLNIFTDAFGSEATNLKGTAKLQAIRAHAETNGYKKWSYAGDSRADLAIWSSECEQIIAVNAQPSLVKQVNQLKGRKSQPPTLVFPAPSATFKNWLKAIRITQWSKNALLFIPLLAAHLSNSQAWINVFFAFIAFGLCASATYLINDLLDLASDRRHTSKRFRPLAAALIRIEHAVLAAVLLLALAFLIAGNLSLSFTLALLAYTLLTLCYSLSLKKIAIIDVVVLSMLYTLRLIAGALVANVVLSNWLLAISIFLFLSLALIKRCAELEELQGLKNQQTPGRGYLAADLPSLRSMGVASGFLSVMVLTLYVDSQNGKALYAHPQWLWAVAPVLLLWLMRIWLKTGRRELEGEDPLLFALKDPYSWLTVFVIGLFALLASNRLGF